MEKIEEEIDGDDGRPPSGAQAALKSDTSPVQIRQRALHRRPNAGEMTARLLRSQSAVCYPEPRVVPLRHSPHRARRSHSLPITPSPSIIEKLTLDRMPCSPKLSPEERGGPMDTSPLSSPSSSPVSPSGHAVLERKRSLDFSQLHSLGVIREQDP